ncbi:hypothetical protein [Phyllobacterium sp. YR531]|uniref:hypothetical protein n=1 Tax=Phyllobacterium sp. YR531 TaxID=1144343 RepID=UPI00026FC313|nr:hypothetical protein [Phyllobacterium sp. YR531]EJN06804.1 hypothetical protein PMI41_00095 [Phyllobacterium sp. YR531]
MNFTFDVSNFVLGLLTGGVGGALLTYQVTKTFRAGTNGNAVDQSRAKAGRDIVGRDKTTHGS